MCIRDRPKGAQRGLVQSRPTEQKISGVAGSGTTQVLAIRAINALKRTGGNVLILTFNITLANYLRSRLSEIREDFYWDKIEICHYHKFFRLRAYEGNPKPKIRLNSYEDITFFDHIAGTKRYAAIFGAVSYTRLDVYKRQLVGRGSHLYPPAPRCL